MPGSILGQTVLPIDFSEKSLVSFCTHWKVAELALFGSVLRSDFSLDSDIDVLVTFSPQARWSLFDLVRMQEELEKIFRRPVDLVERAAVANSPNYIRRKNIIQGAKVIYAAR